MTTPADDTGLAEEGRPSDDGLMERARAFLDSRNVPMRCVRHGEVRHDPFTAECVECLAVTPRCAGPSGGCSGLGDPDPAAHDPNECLMGDFT